MTATVKITDAKGNIVMTKQFEPASIERAADKFRILYPDGFVTVSNEKDFVSLQPLNMIRDEEKVNNDEMSFTSFTSKWYPAKKKTKEPKAKDIEKELAAEFAMDDIDSDPYGNDKPYEDCNGDD
jgi:hypothetical protein